MSENPTILALGGGGARGLAHLGVIEVLEDAGVSIDRVVGVSIGSLLGAIFAFDPDVRRNQSTVLHYVASPEFQSHQQVLYGTRSGNEERTGWFRRVQDYLRANRAFHRVILRRSLLSGKVLEGIVSGLLPDRDIAESEVPLTVVAVDLCSGHRVVLERGPLRTSVYGSSALPGIFPPAPMEGKLLSDIGIFYAVPSKIARYYNPEIVIAVDVTMDLMSGFEPDGSALDTMMRMQDIGGHLMREETISAADVVIRPDVGSIEWMDFSRAEETIELGRAAARQALPEIDAHLRARRGARGSRRNAI